MWTTNKLQSRRAIMATARRTITRSAAQTLFARDIMSSSVSIFASISIDAPNSSRHAVLPSHAM